MASRCLIIIFLSTLSYVSDAATNVALNKPVSSNAVREFNGTYLIPERAVDGIFNTIFPDVFESTANGGYSWWKVNLKQVVEDAIVVIWLRTLYTWRRNGLELYTSSSDITSVNSATWTPAPSVTLCHRITGRADGSDIPDVYRVRCPGQWQYLMIYTKTDNRLGAVIELGEVQVMVCMRGKYGDNCEKDCNSRRCNLPSSCDYETGECQNGCQSMFTGADCTACVSGKYGSNCGKDCNSRHCNGESNCDYKTGTCTNGCQSSYSGTHCTECSQGRYGSTCSKFCTARHCSWDSSCTRFTHNCINGECLPGYRNPDCAEPCTWGTYGNNCKQICQARRCTGRLDCDNVPGTCVDGCQTNFTREDCTEAVLVRVPVFTRDDSLQRHEHVSVKVSRKFHQTGLGNDDWQQNNTTTCHGTKEMDNILIHEDPNFVVQITPSLTNTRGYIQTVGPSPSKTSLLWKLVDDDDVKTIVILTPSKGTVLPGPRETVKYGGFSVTSGTNLTLSHDINHVTVNSRDHTQFVGRSVGVFQTTRSLHLEAILSLFANCKALRELTLEFDPVMIVHSEEDKTSAMYFCIMCNIVGTILTDSRVDVIHSLRTYVNHVPDLQITEEDVHLLYNAVCMVLQTCERDATYANMFDSAENSDPYANIL